VPAALSRSTAGTIALESNGASTMASGLLRMTSSMSPSAPTAPRGDEMHGLGAERGGRISAPMRAAQDRIGRIAGEGGDGLGGAGAQPGEGRDHGCEAGTRTSIVLARCPCLPVVS
jgi:hypothetical protein